MKIAKWICAVLICVALMPPVFAFAGEEAMPISDPIYDAGSVSVTFTANEDFVLCRLWVFSDVGKQVVFDRMELEPGSMEWIEKAPAGMPGSMQIMLIKAGSVVKLGTSERYFDPETIDRVLIWQDKSGAEKLEYDYQEQAWVGPGHNLYFHQPYCRDDDTVTLYPIRDVYVYGVTAITANGKWIKASSVTNEFRTMFTRGGTTMLQGSMMQMPGEIGLSAGGKMNFTVAGVTETDIARVIIQLDKNGRETLEYDFDSEAWID